MAYFQWQDSETWFSRLPAELAHEIDNKIMLAREGFMDAPKPVPPCPRYDMIETIGPNGPVLKVGNPNFWLLGPKAKYMVRLTRNSGDKAFTIVGELEGLKSLFNPSYVPDLRTRLVWNYKLCDIHLERYRRVDSCPTCLTEALRRVKSLMLAK